MNPNIKSFFQFAVAHHLRVLHDDRKLFEPGLQQHLQQRTIILDDILGPFCRITLSFYSETGPDRKTDNG